MNSSKWLGVALLAGTMMAHAATASAKTCAVNIEGTDAMQFSQKTIAVAADCTEVELTLKHVGKLPITAMGHNWVLTETPVFQAVANAGMTAGPANDYLPPGDKRVIAHTKVVGGGQSTSVKFPTSALKKGGDYTFFCSFPGHWAVMQGKLTFG